MQSIVFIKISEKILQIKFQSIVHQAKANKTIHSNMEVSMQQTTAFHAWIPKLLDLISIFKLKP